MRILQIIQKQQKRGAEIFACQLSNHLDKLGNTTKIVAVFRGDANMPYHGNISCLEASEKFKFLDLSAWRRLSDIIKDFNPDIVQVNAGDTLKYAVFSKLVFQWDNPIISRNASQVGKYFNSFVQKSMNKFFYTNVAGIISVSKASMEDILLHFPFLQGRIEVIPVGLEEPKSIERIELPGHGRHIVHVGGFTFEKNHIGLLNIFEKVLDEEPAVNLHLVGDGPLRDKIEREVKLRKLENRVYFYGFVHNPLSFIKAADVVVLPSIIEGLPGVILEAMICKTPVVAYNVGGIPEILHVSTGALVEKDDEEAFSKTVIKTLQKNLNGGVIDSAFEMVKKHYMNVDIARRFSAFYVRVRERDKI